MGEVIANYLNAPLDIVLTKKIGAPHNPELAIGAVSMDDHSVHPYFAHYATPEYIETEVPKLQTLLRDRYRLYKDKDYDPHDMPFKSKRVIIVDDGIATGQTFIETVMAVRKQQPKEIIAAVPVIAQDTVPMIHEVVDNLVDLLVPDTFHAVGQFYREFPQVSDEAAVTILKRTNLSKS